MPLASDILEKFKIKKIVKAGVIIKKKVKIHKLKPKQGFDRAFVNGVEKYVKQSQSQKIARKKKKKPAQIAKQKRSAKKQRRI